MSRDFSQKAGFAPRRDVLQFTWAADCRLGNGTNNLPDKSEAGDDPFSGRHPHSLSKKKQ